MDPKKRKLNVLTSYFAKQNVNSAGSEKTGTDTRQHQEPSCSESGSESVLTPVHQNVEPPPSLAINADIKQDIITFTNNTIPEDNRHHLFTNCVQVPPKSFTFPESGSRNLRFQHSWLSRWTWLAYSESTDGAFCSVCIFYANSAEPNKNRANLNLVKQPFKKWKDAVETFNKHQQMDIHQFAALRQSTRAQVELNNVDSIEMQVNSAFQTQVRQNRAALLPIIERYYFAADKISHYEDTLKMGLFSTRPM